ncbi:MAG TPA: hypothetical protein VHV30_06065 [Polyangiaceae bacterium]|nr:hypothetical protein [Polyangiaceae bacterium]
MPCSVKLPLRSLGPRGIASLVVFAGIGAVGFLPLFGGPGYEHALASGVVVPSAAAIATAIEASARDGTDDASDAPVACVGRGVATGWLLAGVAFLTAIVHGVRVGICDFWGGAILFLLTAGFGGAMGGAWGAIAAEIARGRRRRRLIAVLAALAGPIAGIVVSVARFYASPMIFAYDPFFGYFSGTLYDTVVDVRPELWTYRAGSAATLGGLALVAAAFTRTKPRRFALREGGRARVLLGLGGALLVASGAVTVEGAVLGHWQTSSTIAEALGGRASGPRCDVVYPDALLGFQADLLVRDCEEELAADEARLDAHLPGRLTAFVFPDANEKRRLMGAADTSIAKPWRHEVYIQYAPYPHPVLGHEIAHVVSGTFAAGPFHVAGGVVPNPGLIEGIAVATSPDDDELSDAQWARAMLDIGTLPPTKTLFSLDFLGSSASKSYTVAGAFVGWVLETWTPRVVQRWYAGASIEALTQSSWSALDDKFRAWLRTLPMPPEAQAYARAKFERPSVWARRCPHVVDALDREGDRCRDAHRFARADALYADALARDARDEHARFARARLAAQSTDPAAHVEGRSALEAMASAVDAPRTWRDRAQEALADDDLVRGRAREAGEAYRAIAARTLDEDVARTLEVKALAADDPEARQALVDLLLADPGHAQDAWLGAFALGDFAGASTSGSMAPPAAPLAQYLAGKNLTSHELYARAVPWLDRAIAGVGALPSARVGREVLRQRGIAACAMRDSDAIDRVKAAVSAPGSPFADSSGGRRESLLRLLARCRGE